MDKTYEYPMATNSPAQVHETLDKHMAALQEVGEKMNVAFEEEAAGHDSMTKVVNSLNMDEQARDSVCSGSVVVTAYDFESSRPGSSPEWGD